jgi:hypothetical protein
MFGRPTLLLKRSLLLGWSVWWTVVFFTNVLDAGKALGLLDERWSFASGNFDFLKTTTARYGTPRWLNALLFGGVIAWEGTATLLFWLAWRGYRGRDGEGKPLRYTAFTAGLSLWLAFLIADEVCIAYAVAATHLRLFVAQLLTLLAIELLPEDAPLPS